MKTIPSFVRSVVLALVLAVASAIIVPRAAYAQIEEEDTEPAEAKEMFAVVGQKYKARISIDRSANDSEGKWVKITCNLLSFSADGTPSLRPLPDAKPFAKVIQIRKKRVNLNFIPTADLADSSVLVRVQLLTSETGTPVSPAVEGYCVIPVKPVTFVTANETEKDQDIRTVKSPIGVGRR